jgi:hypothetical protein
VTPSFRRELALVLAGFAALAVLFTFPLALHPGSLIYRIDNFDAQFSVWNIAWVARTLVVDPLHVFDANIFFPHRWTLAYSETNLGTGALALPVYWVTRNPYAAHNFVVIVSFVLTGTGMYYLTRYLSADRGAAVVGAICFAFCPHVFAHLPHIQLLMTAGLPFSLLAFYRMADTPTFGRGAALGAVMAAQAYFCSYYAVFGMLLIGLAVLFTAGARGLWRDTRYWASVGIAALTAIVLAAPLAAVYAMIQRTTGFKRTVADAASFAANWSAYFASSAYAHAWMLAYLPRWGDVLFPGFVALILGLAGAVLGWKAGGRLREITAFYVLVAGLAFWESFGPRGGLYPITYALVPGFTFLRASSRFGLLVVLSLSVLATLTVARMRAALGGSRGLVAVLVAVTIGELLVPLRLMPVPPPEPAYAALALQPKGALLELPEYSETFAYVRARYMLGSTRHWMPLVDAYSDYIPQDFRDEADVLGDFPTRDSIALLQRQGVRYALIHVSDYKGKMGASLEARLKEFASSLRPLYADANDRLYEISGAR